MKDRRILVTGGFGVLGAAVGRALLEAGGRVALLDLADAPRDALPPGAAAVGGVDLTDPASAQAGVDRAAAELRGLDGLANIAGGFAWESLEDGAAETWERLFKLNLATAVNATRAALPRLKAAPAGRIVNVGAAGAVKAAAGMGAYAASKAGVMRFTEALAEELKPTPVTVNAVLPTIIDTPANRASMGEKNAHKWVAPKDLAAVIVFLLSDASRAVTGALVPVAGKV